MVAGCNKALFLERVKNKAANKRCIGDYGCYSHARHCATAVVLAPKVAQQLSRKQSLTMMHYQCPSSRMRSSCCGRLALRASGLSTTTWCTTCAMPGALISTPWLSCHAYSTCCCLVLRRCHSDCCRATTCAAAGGMRAHPHMQENSLLLTLLRLTHLPSLEKKLAGLLCFHIPPHHIPPSNDSPAIPWPAAPSSVRQWAPRHHVAGWLQSLHGGGAAGPPCIEHPPAAEAAAEHACAFHNPHHSCAVL